MEDELKRMVRQLDALTESVARVREDVARLVALTNGGPGRSAGCLEQARRIEALERAVGSVRGQIMLYAGGLAVLVWVANHFWPVLSKVL